MKRLKRTLMIIMTIALLVTQSGFFVLAANTENEGITRAEWLSQLVKTFDMKVEDENYPDNYFNDLDSSSAYYYDVLIATQFGVVDVQAGDSVYPNEVLTRAYAAKTLNYCLGYQLEENVCVYKAEKVEKTGSDYIIEGSEVEHDQAYEAVDMQGTMDASALQFGDTADGLKMNYTEKTVEPEKKSRGTISLDKDTELNVSGKVKVAGVDVSVKMAMKNAQIDYAVSLTGETFVKLKGNTDFTCSAATDLMKVAGIDEITLIPAQVPGVGGIDMIAEISLGGKFSSKISGYMTAGVSYSKSNGLRIIKGFNTKAFSLSCEASTSAGIKVRFGISGKAVPFKGYVYTKFGGKAEIKHVVYGSGTPASCTEYGAYVYASAGGTLSIKLGKISSSLDNDYEIYGKNNSPLRCYHHYEDNKEVAACSRGKEFKYYTRYKSRNWGSGWYGGMGSQGYDDEGKPVAVYTYSLDENNNATITGYKGNATYLTIPDTIDGYTVVGIGSSVFRGNKSIIEVDIPDTVTEIGEYAFENCTGLTEVELPKNLTYLGIAAFGSCPGLSEIKIPKTMKTADRHWNGAGPFSNCVNLSRITLEEGMTRIPDNLFSNCTGAMKVRIPSTVTSIGSRAFDCSGIVELIIPDTVTEIGEYAFENCTGLTAVELPKNITYLGKMAFAGTSLKKITVPDKVANFAGYVFNNCQELEQAVIENNAIPEGTFEGCSKLKNVKLPDALTVIRRRTFKDCTSLEEIKLGEQIQTIEDAAFSNCQMLKMITLPDSVIQIGQKTFNNCDALENIIIPDSVTSFGTSMFYDCDALQNVTLGTGLTSIPTSTFEHCDVLEAVVLPYRVKSIGANAFKDSIKFKKITIPRATTTIDETAFSYPANLTIYGVAGTYAETFAKENAINFVNEEVKATEVTLSNSTLVLNKGSKSNLVMNVKPNNFTDEVKWKSSADSVVTIDDTGLVTAKSVGNATIKVTVGNVSATCKVTVVQPVTSISINKTSLTLEALDSYQLKASVYPNDANNKEVSWKSSDEKVVKVDQTGLITAMGKGSAIVTVTAKDGSEKEKTCKVTVTNNGYDVTDVEKLESSHNYECNSSDFWVYQVKDAQNLSITFDERTNLEDGFDYLYIFDEKGNQVGKYTGTELAGKTITVSGDYVKMKLISDDAGTEWGFKVTSVVKGEKTEEVHKHSYSTAVVKPTCKEKGYTLYTCSCGHSYKDNYTAIVDHTYDAGTVTKDATCISEGTKKYTCKICGQKKYSLIEMKTHNYKQIKVSPTCTKKGYTKYECTWCEHSYVDEYIDTVEHQWKEIIDKVATTSSAGLKHEECTVCGEKRKEGTIIDKLPVPKGSILVDKKVTYKVMAAGSVAYVKSTAAASSITIPSTVTIDGNTYKVTSIAANAFKNNKKLKKVVIGSNVTSIGKEAFSGCTKLTSVTLGKNVTTMGDKSFYKCSALAKITIPAKVNKIGKQAFYGCKKLKSITIKTTKLTTKNVGTKAFQGIYAKATIKVPKQKLNAYKKMLIARGASKKVKIKK